MSQENILASFQKELGYMNATNQYIETSVRLFEKNYNVDDIKSHAESVNLNISCLTEDYRVRISKGYIINVDSSFERFLKDLKELPGSSTNISTVRRADDESWLTWTLKVTFDTRPQEIENDIAICEYYHLIRNRIVHTGKIDASLKHRKSRIKKNADNRLSAPNDLDAIDFDDQVLFSRAVYNVAKYIFNHSSYDMDVIIRSYKNELEKIILPNKQTTNKERLSNKVQRFFSIIYPKFNDVNWIDMTDKIMDLINN